MVRLTSSFFRRKSYINFLMLLRVIGWLLVTEALMMVLPCLCGVLYNEDSWLQFLICIGITGGVGAALVSLRTNSREMGKREAILLTSLTWVILSLFGMLPFLICGTHLNVTDAFFETMSGFTTTGATVLDTLENVPHSVLLWRCVCQWIGGLGIILFTLAIVPMLNYQGGIQLFNAEVTGVTHDKLRPRIGYTSKGLWLVYIVLTAVLIILLSFSELDLFDSICYGLSTMSTGGFSNYDHSITEENGIYIKIVMTIFMFIGGINFSLLFKASNGQFAAMKNNNALRVYFWITFCGYMVFAINVFIKGLGNELADFTIDPMFQAVSILSSTGLTEPDFHEWGGIAILAMVIMMLMGACAGSTSGGAKIDRFIILFKFLRNEFYRLMHPNAVRPVVINGKGIQHSLVMKSIAFLFLYIIIILCGGIMLSMFGLPIVDSFFCALSAVSNTGIGTGMTGVEGNYSLLSDISKWVICFLMLVGRLELFTVLVIFTPAFWKR